MKLLNFTVTSLLFYGLLASGLAVAQVQVTIESEKDNTLYEDSTGSFSNGAGNYSIAGKSTVGLNRRALLSFNIASNVPFGSLIDSVMLTFNISIVPGIPVTIELRRVLSDWGEGISNANGNELTGVATTPGDATWIHNFYDTLFWAVAGGDLDGVNSANHTVDTIGPHTWGSTPQMVADVQDWLDNPTSNFGWALSDAVFDSLSVIRLTSRDHPSAQQRPSLTIFYSVPVGIFEDILLLPIDHKLNQNYPNPFNPTTTIEYSLSSRSHVMISIYNLLGQHVRTLVDEEKRLGSYSVIWDALNSAGRPVSSGIFLYRFQAGNYVESKKMTLLK